MIDSCLPAKLQDTPAVYLLRAIAEWLSLDTLTTNHMACTCVLDNQSPDSQHAVTAGREQRSTV